MRSEILEGVIQTLTAFLALSLAQPWQCLGQCSHIPILCVVSHSQHHHPMVWGWDHLLLLMLHPAVSGSWTRVAVPQVSLWATAQVCGDTVWSNGVRPGTARDKSLTVVVAPQNPFFLLTLKVQVVFLMLLLCIPR